MVASKAAAASGSSLSSAAGMMSESRPAWAPQLLRSDSWKGGASSAAEYARLLLMHGRPQTEAAAIAAMLQAAWRCKARGCGEKGGSRRSRTASLAWRGSCCGRTRRRGGGESRRILRWTTWREAAIENDGLETRNGLLWGCCKMRTNHAQIRCSPIASRLNQSNDWRAGQPRPPTLPSHRRRHDFACYHLLCPKPVWRTGYAGS